MTSVARLVSRPHERLVALLLVVLLTAAAHWPVLHAQAVSLDDDQFVNQNPLVTHPSWHSAACFFAEVSKPSTVPGYYLPLTMTSLMLDVASGGRPGDWFVFHRTNLLLHLFVTALVVLLLERLFGALLPAAIVGLVFGLHPLAVEPVAWVSERKTLLATFFTLASLACYVEGARGRGRAWSVAAIALYVPALLAKPTVTPLPVLLLVIDAWPLRRLSVRSLIEKLPYFALAATSAAIAFLSTRHTTGTVAPSRADLFGWPVQVGNVLLFYLGKMVRPVNLSCVYPAPVVPPLVPPGTAWGLIAIVALTLVLAVVARRERGPLAGWAFFVIAIAPTLGMINHNFVFASDKYLYFPAFGLLMVAAAGLAFVWGRTRGTVVRVALVVSAVALLAVETRGTRAALVPWRDSLSLFRHMESVTPTSPVVENHLGLLIGRSNEAEALEHFRRAVELADGFAEAQHNYGIALADAGRFAEAIPHLRRAVELEPTNAVSVAHLGRALLASGDVVVGRSELERAAGLAPSDAETQLGLALALLATPGRTADAVAHLRRAIALRPDDAIALNELAWVLATTAEASVRDAAVALELAGRATALTARRDATALDTEAAAFAAAGRFEEAIATGLEALALVTAAPSDSALAQGIRERLVLYRHARPYVEQPAALP